MRKKEEIQMTSKSRIAVCQEISDQINQKFNPRYFACPGVDRIGIGANTQNENEITIVKADNPQIEMHIFPYLAMRAELLPVEDKDFNNAKQFTKDAKQFIGITHRVLAD